MKKVSAVVLVATIAFFVITSTSASIGKEYAYRNDTFGWPNKFFTVTYEKTTITNLDIQPQNMLLNFSLCLAVVGGIRLMFLFMRVKRPKPAPSNAANSVSLVK